MNLEFSRQKLNKFSDINFYENPFSVSRLVPCGQTDGETDGNEEANNHSFTISRMRLKKWWLELINLFCHTKISFLYRFLRTDQHFNTTLSKQCAARVVKNLFLHVQMRPWSCVQQIHQKINNCLLVDRAPYIRRLDSSCPYPIGCKKYWHVTHLCKSNQVYLDRDFVPFFHAISKKHCIMNSRSYCSWRIISNVTRFMWIHFGSSNSMPEICFIYVCFMVGFFWVDMW
jgi:hypothetical protein